MQTEVVYKATLREEKGNHSTRESKSLKVNTEVQNVGSICSIFSSYFYISFYCFGIIEKEIKNRSQSPCLVYSRQFLVQSVHFPMPAH